MILVKDGPAARVQLPIDRFPVFLRITRTSVPGTPATFDALDQLSDEPLDREEVFVYIRDGKPSWAFIDYTDRVSGRRRGGRMGMATYRLYHEQPTGAILRNSALWRQWAAEQFERMSEEEPPADVRQGTMFHEEGSAM